MLGNNWLALAATFLLALLWLRINDFLAHKGWISGPLSRKIIHIGTGPIYVLSWLFFQNTASARYLAMLVPLAITFQFLLVGTGVLKDQASVDAMSRTGDRREILKGPLFYGLVFVILTILFWKDNPIGIIGLMLLCGGDGFADIIGKRVGNGKLPWSLQKSWAGSLAMLIGGWTFAVVILGVFLAAHVFPGNISNYLVAITVIAIVGAIVESFPFRDIDNLTVPSVAIIIGHFLIR
jgi:phytol kinase